MKTKIVGKVTQEVDASSIPDGDYDGVWGGYEAVFHADGIRYFVRTEIGIRTPAAPCRVRVSSGKVDVRAT